MKLIRNLVRFVPEATAFLMGIYRQKRFLRKNIQPFIHSFERETNSKLEREDIRKIFNYYGLAVPAISGELFCRLRGYSMSEDERLLATGLGVLTGFFDDFFDVRQMQEADILQIVNSAEKAENSPPSDKFFRFFGKQLLERLPAGFLEAETVKVLIDSQIQSRKQQDVPDLNRDEIRHITYLKGGASVMFFRNVFSNHLMDGEEDALKLAGAVFQYGNDIFDVFEDLQHGIQTLPNTAIDIYQVGEEFYDLLRQTSTCFYSLPYPRPNIEKALILLHVIAGRCQVCLNQFQKLQDQNQGKWLPVSFERSDLICDMEKPMNMLRSTLFYLRNR